MKRPSIVYESKGKRIKLSSEIIQNYIEDDNGRIAKLLETDPVVCTNITLEACHASIAAKLLVSKDNTVSWVSSISCKSYSILDTWIMYNFNLFDLMMKSSTMIKWNCSEWDDVGVSLLHIYTIKRIPTDEDLPFWCIYNEELEFVENLKEGVYYNIIRDFGITKKIPVQSLLCYLAIEFKLSIDLLNSLYWNSETPEYSDIYIGDSPNSGGQLIWNM